MQEYTEEIKILKYWYCTFSMLFTMVKLQYQEHIKSYLQWIESTLKDLRIYNPLKDYNYIKGLISLNLEVFQNFMKIIIAPSCNLR